MPQRREPSLECAVVRVALARDPAARAGVVAAPAAEAELADAAPLRDNAFKIELATRAIVATLTELTGVAA